MIDLHVHDVDHLAVVERIDPDDPVVQLQRRPLVRRAIHHDSHDLGRPVVFGLQQRSDPDQRVRHTGAKALHLAGTHIVGVRIMGASHRTQKVIGDILLVGVFHRMQESLVTKGNFRTRSLLAVQGIFLPLFVCEPLHDFAPQCLGKKGLLDLQLPESFRFRCRLRPVLILPGPSHEPILAEVEIRLLEDRLRHADPLAHPFRIKIVDLTGGFHTVAPDQEIVQATPILLLKPGNIRLREIQTGRIEIVEIVAENPLAQFLIKRDAGIMAVLEHSSHLPSDHIEIGLSLQRNR